jgi:hypothetical protein
MSNTPSKSDVALKTARWAIGFSGLSWLILTGWIISDSMSDTISLQTLQIVNESGVLVGEITGRGDQTYILLGTEGQAQLSLDAMSLRMAGADGQPRLSLVANDQLNTLRFMDSSGRPVVSLDGGDDQGTLSINSGDSTATLAANPDQGGRLFLSLDGSRTAEIELGQAGNAPGPDLHLRDGGRTLLYSVEQDGNDLKPDE